VVTRPVRLVRALGFTTFTVALLAGCGSSSKSSSITARNFTQIEVNAAALFVNDLPTGWAVASPTLNNVAVCNATPFIKAVPPIALANVAFVMGTSYPLLQEQVLSYADTAHANSAMAVAGSNARACTTFQNIATTIGVAKISVPPLGDRTLAYRLTLTQKGKSAIFDTGVYQKGSVLIWVGYGDTTAPNDTFAKYSKLAYDKAVSTLNLQ
jgi:hypothetical protein